MSGPYPLAAGSRLVSDAFLTHIPVLGVCNDHGKTYALYAITVFRKNPDGSEDTWKTYRRYSDFHDFHMRITEQVKYEPDSAAPSGGHSDELSSPPVSCRVNSESFFR